MKARAKGARGPARAARGLRSPESRTADAAGCGRGYLEAVVVARRGKIRLASEIAVSSAAQVALFVAPLAALLSFLVRPPLPLAFRPVELATIAGSALFVGAVVWLVWLRGHAPLQRRPGDAPPSRTDEVDAVA